MDSKCKQKHVLGFGFRECRKITRNMINICEIRAPQSKKNVYSPAAIIFTQFGTSKQQIASFSSPSVSDSHIPQRHQVFTEARRFSVASSAVDSSSEAVVEWFSSDVSDSTILIGWWAYSRGRRSCTIPTNISHSSSLPAENETSAIIANSDLRKASWDIGLLTSQDGWEWILPGSQGEVAFMPI